MRYRINMYDGRRPVRREFVECLTIEEAKRHVSDAVHVSQCNNAVVCDADGIFAFRFPTRHA